MFQIKFSFEARRQFQNLQKTKNKQIEFKAVVKALGYMQVNLRHPGLRTHKFTNMKSPFDGDVFESYAQNKTPGAYRIFWTFGPSKGEITVLAIIPHP